MSTPDERRQVAMSFLTPEMEFDIGSEAIDLLEWTSDTEDMSSDTRSTATPSTSDSGGDMNRFSCHMQPYGSTITRGDAAHVDSSGPDETEQQPAATGSSADIATFNPAASTVWNCGKQRATSSAHRRNATSRLFKQIRGELFCSPCRSEERSKLASLFCLASELPRRRPSRSDREA